MTRTCVQCGAPLASSSPLARYCSGRCRTRAHRGGTPISPLRLVGSTTPPVVDVSTDRLDALRAQAALLKAAVQSCPPERLAPLSREYRETLRELDAVQVARESAQQAGPGAGTRRRFEPDAI